MTSYIEQAACKGRQPHGFAAHQRRSRSNLVARLLRQRRVARFIVAPDGYGKSYLAFEYALVVFSFNHVFWLNARSPCFLRDLDAQTMYAEIKQVDYDECLVVFDDLPHLDRERAVLFSRLVDRLLAGGNEVLVTCTPSHDVFGELHKDRVVFDGRDIMLDEGEMRAALTERVRESGDASPIVACEAIACLRWDSEGMARLMEGLGQEELSGEVLLAVFSLLLLQSGQVSDAEAFLGSSLPRGTLDDLAKWYPLLGIDMKEGVYEAVRADVDSLVRGFGPHVDFMAGVSAFDGHEAFVMRCADALVVRGLGERALSLSLELSPKRSVSRWLASRGWNLLELVTPKAVVDAYVRLDRSIPRRKTVFYAFVAWALIMLDDRSEALAFARRAAFSQVEENTARVVGCVVLARMGEGDEREKACGHLRKLIEAHDLGVAQSESAYPEDDPEVAAIWPRAADLALAFEEGVACGASMLAQLIAEFERSAGVGGGSKALRNLLLSGCSWVFDGIADGRARVGVPPDMRWAKGADLPVGFMDGREFERILDFSCRAVEHAAMVRGRVGWFDMRLASAIERAFEFDPLALTRLPAFTALTVMRSEQLALLAQRDVYRRVGPHGISGLLAPMGSLARVPSESASEPGSAATRRLPPMLRVNLFGTFEVRLGDERVDPRLFSRQKTRTLQAILVISRGKEYTRARLAEMLWPTSNELSARKSFYALWARLKNALSINGECPYLLRDQFGCRVNPNLLVSDVQEFEEMCRMLLFGRSDERGWEYVFSQVSVDFAEVLLPGETSNDFVLAMRDHYQTQLVDALVAASSRMVANGEVRGALWFAREALKRDRTREDVYVAQMEAQIAAEQRVAAIETFYQCRKFLAKDLGIDPSMRIVNLYRSIIESEEEFS